MKLNTAMKQLVLADCSVFQNLDRAVLSLLAETARAEVFLPGELLVEVDEEADCAFVIIEGRVGVLVPGVDEPIHHMGPGDSVG